MTSPLAIYNETAERFGITDKKQVHIRRKLAFVEEQVQAMQEVCNRLLCDIVATTCALGEAKDENTKAAIEGKLRQYEGDLRQTAPAMEYYIKLKDEFTAEFKKSGEEA